MSQTGVMHEKYIIKGSLNKKNQNNSIRLVVSYWGNDLLLFYWSKGRAYHLGESLLLNYRGWQQSS